MKLESYWLDTRPAFRAGNEGPVEGRADVVVIGGGFTGLSAALALAQRGVSVVVLEAAQVAGEASAATAASAIPVSRRTMRRWPRASASSRRKRSIVLTQAR